MADAQYEKFADAGERLDPPVAPPTPESFGEPEPLPFGQNLLGITFLADDWEADLSSELFEGEDSFKP